MTPQSPETVHTTGGEAATPPRTERFGLDVVTLASGATLAEGVNLLLAPLLSRCFSPSAFGLLAVFTSVFSIGLLIVCPGYQSALVLPEKDREAGALLKGGLWLLGVMLAIVSLATLLGGDALCGLMRVPELSRYLWLLVPALVAGGLGILLRFWNTRRARFGVISTMTVTGTLCRGVLRVLACAPRWVGGGTLIVTKILGDWVVALSLLWTTWRADRQLLSGIPAAEVRSQLSRYRKFPLVSIWSNLLGTLSYQAPILLLSTFFSAAAVGHYSFGLHLIGLPVIIGGGSVAQVFLQRASEARRQGRLPVVVSDMYRHLVRLGLLPMLALGVAGREIFEVVFGPAWSEAGIYVQILAAAYFFLFMGQPISMLFSLLERQEVEVVFNLLFLSGRVAAIAIGGWLGSPRLAVAWLCASGVILWLIALNWLFRLCGVSRLSLLRILGVSLVQSSLCLILPVLGKWWWGWSAPLVLATVGAGAAVYYLMLIWREPALSQLLVLSWRKVRRSEAVDVGE